MNKMKIIVNKMIFFLQQPNENRIIMSERQMQIQKKSHDYVMIYSKRIT
jgi:hypothetical protein